MRYRFLANIMPVCNLFQVKLKSCSFWKKEQQTAHILSLKETFRMSEVLF
jgi:hypothetical protein